VEQRTTATRAMKWNALSPSSRVSSSQSTVGGHHEVETGAVALLSLAASGKRVEEAKALFWRSRVDVNDTLKDGSGLTALHLACQADNSGLVALLLANSDIDVNAKAAQNCTPFMAACTSNALSTVRWLLRDSRVNINTPEASGRTPFRAAAVKGHLGVIKMILASGREVNADIPDDDLANPAETASDQGVVARLMAEFKKDKAATRGALQVELGMQSTFFTLSPQVEAHSL